MKLACLHTGLHLTLNDVAFVVNRILESGDCYLERIAGYIQNPEHLISYEDAYFLFWLSHQAYLLFRGTSVESKYLSGLLESFKDIIEIASDEGWQPKQGDRYFLGNLRGDADPQQPLLDQIISKTQQTIELINKNDFYEGGAEFHARNPQVVLPSIDITIEGLNKAIRPNFTKIFVLASMGYQLIRHPEDKEQSFKDSSQMEAGASRFKIHTFNAGNITLKAINSGGRLVSSLSIDSTPIEIGMNWRTLLDWRRLFLSSDSLRVSASEMHLLHISEDNVWLLELNRGGIRLNLTEDLRRNIIEVIQSVFQEQELRPFIDQSKIYYGCI